MSVPDLAASGDLAKALLPSARRKLRPLDGVIDKAGAVRSLAYAAWHRREFYIGLALSRSSEVFTRNVRTCTLFARIHAQLPFSPDPPRDSGRQAEESRVAVFLGSTGTTTPRLWLMTHARLGQLNDPAKRLVDSLLDRVGDLFLDLRDQLGLSRSLVADGSKSLAAAHEQLTHEEIPRQPQLVRGVIDPVSEFRRHTDEDSPHVPDAGSRRNGFGSLWHGHSVSTLVARRDVCRKMWTTQPPPLSASSGVCDAPARQRFGHGLLDRVGTDIAERLDALRGACLGGA